MNKAYLEVETPFYVIDYDKLIHNYNSLEEALKSRWQQYHIGYSFKTNALPWIVHKLRELGAYAEIVSEAEYHLALKMGYEKNQIIFNGPHKGFKAMEEVLEAGGIVNLDSFHEIEWLKNHRPKKKAYWEVGIRMNFDLEKVCPNETIMGEAGGRFGFNIENGAFNKAISLLKALPYVKIVGIHGHHSTKTKSLHVFKSIASKIVEITEAFREEIQYIDMGGCFFGDKPNAPTFMEYVEVITENLSKAFDPNITTLILEPGAALIASPVKYVCKAIDCKDVGDTRFVGIDGSLIHIAPQLNNHKILSEIYATGEKKIDKQILAGFTCIEKDRILVEENTNEIKQGDYILFNNVGAYSMALSPLFIQFYPAVYVEQEKKLELVRDKWSIEEYISECKWK